MVSIVNKQRGLIKSRTLCSIPLYPLCSSIPLLHTVLNLPVDGVDPVGQIVQMDLRPAPVYIVTSGTKIPDDACIKKLQNALLAPGAAIGLVGVLLAAAPENSTLYASRAKTSCILLLLQALLLRQPQWRSSKGRYYLLIKFSRSQFGKADRFHV